MNNTTKTGLLLIIIGTAVVIIENLIGFFSGGLLDFSISGLILLIGIILMIAGRKEFGERHSKFVIFALILFIINIIVVVILFILIFSSIFSISYSNIENLDLSFIRNIFLIAPIGALIGGLFNIFLVYELEDRNGKIILFIAFLVTIIISFYVLFSGMAIADNWVMNAQNLIDDRSYASISELEKLTEQLQQDLSKISAVGIIGNLLYLVAFIIPYNRIRTGDLVPVLPSHLKRCNNCGRVLQKDFVICPYCCQRYGGVY
jgi:hypothetical protein